MKKEPRHFSKKQIRTEETPLRLNKYLSDAGICSRRKADRLIEAGHVTVDGRKAVLGERIQKGQCVAVDGKDVVPEEKLILLALNKPAGIECTTDSENPDNIVDFVGFETRVFPIGRLDKNSTGLILLTNMGELSDRILRGSNFHEKEYEVEVNRTVTEDFVAKMQQGVSIEIENEGRTVTTRPCRVRKTGPQSFSIILTQGLNRQIRRMCRALGSEVTSLKRVRILNIRLGDLPEGKWRPVTEAELTGLLSCLERKRCETDAPA